MTIRELVTKWDELVVIAQYDESGMDELEELAVRQVDLLNGYNYIFKDGVNCRSTTAKDLIMLIRTILHGVSDTGDIVTDNKFNSNLSVKRMNLDVLLETDIQLI